MSETAFDNRERFLGLLRTSLQPFILFVGACVREGTTEDLRVCRHVVGELLVSAAGMHGAQREHKGDFH